MGTVAPRQHVPAHGPPADAPHRLLSDIGPGAGAPVEADTHPEWGRWRPGGRPAGGAPEPAGEEPERRQPGGMWSLPHPLAQAWGLLGLAYQRLWHRPGLTALALLGVVLAVGLVTSAGFFAEAVDEAMLRQELSQFTRDTGRAPFSTQVYIFPPPERPMTLEEAERSAPFVARTLADAVGLSQKRLGLMVHGGNLPLQPAVGSSRYGQVQELQSVIPTYIADVAAHIVVVAGEPLDGPPASGEAVPVWMHAALAETMGVQVGDAFQLDLGRGVAPIPLAVAGLWKAADPHDPFWFSNPDESLRANLLLRREDYRLRVEPRLSAGTRYVAWNIALNEVEVLPSKARDYLGGFERGLKVLARYLPEARMVNPQNPLRTFAGRQTTLTLRLLSFNVPAFGFLLYFLALTSAIIARWQRRETAMLISRGATTGEVLSLTLAEEVLIFLLGGPLGAGLGLALAQVMGYSVSFLSFQTRDPLPVSLRGINLPLLAAALGVALLARLWPAAQAARQSVVQHEREFARPVRAPFWYRYYLDFLLILPTIYAYQRIGHNRALDLLLQDRVEDIYRDPLLILVPALSVLTGGLLAMRLFPLLMRLLDHLADHLPWVTPHLALRQLGRQSESYINPLLLVIISLALGFYTLSMASSLDRWLPDRIYYRTGADVAFTPFPLSGVDDPSAGVEWIPPREFFLEVPGIADATRVGDYQAELTLGGRLSQGRFLGIDRLDFPGVAWFREDFAAEPLSALMNRLALKPEGILVSERFMSANSLSVGDRIPIRVSLAYNVSVNPIFTVVGSYRYFPTVYQDQETVIGNLDYLFDYYGIPFSYRVYLKLEPGADSAATSAAVGRLGITPANWQDARVLVAEEQAHLERVGVLGTLSVGLLAAAGMAILGLMIYGYASLQERSYRFAILRAIGLSLPQTAGQVVAEYGLLIFYGAVAGAMIGAEVSRLFMPSFGVAGQGPAPLPPLLPVVATGEIALLAVAFAGLMVLLEFAVVASAFRQRLFQLMRMGQGG